MPDINWWQIIPILVGISGFLLAALTQYTTRKDKKRTVVVEVSNGMLTYGPEVSPLMLIIQITNPGNRSVRITSVGLKIPGNTQIIFPYPQSDVTFPHDLPEGRSCTVWTNARDLARNLQEEGYSGKIKVSAFARSAIGMAYRSKPWKIDVDDWGNLSE